MNRIIMHVAVAAVSLMLVAMSGFAGPLDDYYLEKFGEPTANALQKAVLLQEQDTIDGPQCGTPLKHGLKRDWSQLEQPTRITLAKQLAAPVLSGTELTLLSPSGRFLIHYTTSGTDAVPSLAWVQTVAQTFDDVAASYLSLGWKLAPTAAGIPYDVFLRELSALRLYGQTTSGQSLPSPGFANAVGSFIEIDDDYLEAVYQNALVGPLTTAQKALQSLQITAAHEYHHSIQYGYNFFFDVWYAEATATWHEDELYDNVNQLYVYLDDALDNSNLSLDIPASVTTGGGYGRWLFNRHLAENHGADIVRTLWANLATRNSPGGNADIPMTPVLDAVLLSSGSSLGNELFTYAGKLYTDAWTTHLGDIPRIPDISPSGEYASNLVTVVSVPSPSITLPRYSFAYFRLTPPVSPSPTLTLTLTRDAGITAAAFRTANATITTFTPAEGSNVISVPAFSLANEVVLLLVNPTATDNLFAGFSTDGSAIEYFLAGTAITAASAVVTPPSITLSWSPVAGANSYQISRSDTSSTSLTAYATTSSTSFADTSVVADHTYYYSVTPVQSPGATGPASQVRAVTVPASAPAASTGGGGGGGGCFIATAAYGSYLAPQVRILRDFRDSYLLTNAPGRAFVALYYRLSPPVADIIARHELLRLLVRLILTPIVAMVAHLGTTCLLMAGVIVAWVLTKTVPSVRRGIGVSGCRVTRLE